MTPADDSDGGPEVRRRRLLEEFVARMAPDPPRGTERLDRASVQLFRALDERGVAALLLKGPALAQALYRADERRAYVDVDVLVAPDQRQAARDILTGLGYLDAHGSRGIDDVGGVVHEETWLGGPAAAHQGVVVELHLWLSGATADHQRAWQALTRDHGWADVQGQRVPTLSRAGQAMGLATHAAQHGPGYSKGLAELALGLERWPPEVWASAAALAAEIGATEAFAAGLRLVREGAEMAASLGLPSTERADWAIRHAGARPRGTFHLRAFADAERPGARLDLLRRALLPKPSWITSEYAWARRGGWRVPLAYAVHIARAPLWALRAWRFTRRGPR